MAPNPRILGIDLEDAALVAVGIWGTQNISSILSALVPQLKAPIDRLRPGLGMAAYQAVSAAVAAQVVGLFQGSWKSRIGLGGGALAVSNTVNAFAGNVNLIGGEPRLSGFLPLPGAAKQMANGNGNSEPKKLAAPAPAGRLDRTASTVGL